MRHGTRQQRSLRSAHAPFIAPGSTRYGTTAPRRSRRAGQPDVASRQRRQTPFTQRRVAFSGTDPLASTRWMEIRPGSRRDRTGRVVLFVLSQAGAPAPLPPRVALEEPQPQIIVLTPLPEQPTVTPNPVTSTLALTPTAPVNTRLRVQGTGTLGLFLRPAECQQHAD